MSNAATPSAERLIADLMRRLSAPDSFLHFAEMGPLQSGDLMMVGGQVQLAAITDLYLRRLYFALKVGRGPRGKEKATKSQIRERIIPLLHTKRDLVQEVDLLIHTIEQVDVMLAGRNIFAHWAGRDAGVADFIVFASCDDTKKNEGMLIETGKEINYWGNTRPALAFHLAQLQEQVAKLVQLTSPNLKRLRPWLPG